MTHSSIDTSPVDALGALYSEYYRSTKDPDSPTESRTQMVRHLSDFLLRGEGETTVLDIGSGTRQIEGQLVRNAKGNVDPRLQKRLSETHLMSMDIAQLPVRKLKLAQRVMGELVGGHVQADSRAMPFADESFDAVFSNLSIDMLRREPGQFEQAIGELSRVLRLDGEVFLHYHPYELFYSLSDDYQRIMKRGKRDERARYFSGVVEENPFYETEEVIVADLYTVGIGVDNVTFEQDAQGDSWWYVHGRKRI